MKKAKTKKLTSLLLAVLMVLGVLTVAPFTVTGLNNDSQYIITAKSVRYNYVSYEGNTVDVTYRLPKLLVKGSETDTINNEILNSYEDKFESAEEMKEFKSEELSYTQLDYDYYINNDILSVIIHYKYPYNNLITYSIYNFNITTGEVLDNQDIMNQMSISYEEVKKQITNEMVDSLNYYSEFLPQEELQKFYDKNVSNENLNYSRLYIGENNQLMAMYRIYKPAGAGCYYYLMPIKINGIKIYSDHTNLNVKNGDSIKIGAGIFENNQQKTDISKLTFSVDDTSILSVESTSVHENCRFISLKAKTTGTTYITFSDSNTGYVTRVPITVYDNNIMAFTISGVPTQNIEKYTTNFYNVNGLYVDSYKYSTNSDKTTTVSFDVYNTNYIYGAVEVYNSDGKMTDAVVIDKMTNNAGSIKSAVWDNTCCLVRDVIDGDLLSYRQESGYSKKTSVKVTIPENGYIKITTDTSSSFLTALLNGVDILMSLKSVAGDISGFDANSKSFADKITKKLVEEAAYAQFIKDEDKFAKNLVKGVSKKSTIFNSESLGNFSETFVNNLNSLKIEKLIFDTAVDFGWGIGESVLEYFMGPIGAALKGMFSFGDISNLIIEYNHYVKSGSCGSISIQNQGGGVRSASQIIVTSDTNFNSDTALKVFEIQADSELLDIIKKVNPELYEKIQSDLSITYNISMIKDGKEVQPGVEVEVSIPIPESLIAYAYTGKLKIYRVEDDGSVTEMNVKVINGCLVFNTNHFSIYTMTAESISETDYTPGDINNDGKINMKDIVLLQQFLNGWNVSINKQAANVNADSSINMKDIVLLQQYLNGWKVVLK